jgi:hypothetical protein
MLHERNEINEKIIKEKIWLIIKKYKIYFYKFILKKIRLFESRNWIYSKRKENKNLSRIKTSFSLKKCLKITLDGICLNFNTF